MHAATIAEASTPVRVPRIWIKLFVIGATLLLGLKVMNAGFEWLTEDTIEETGKSPEYMAEKTDLPFSHSTRDIHYFFFAGGMQDLEMYCKFRCNAGDTEAVVGDFLNKNLHDREGLHPSTVVVKIMPPFKPMNSARFPQIHWWDLAPAKIVHEVHVDTSYGYHIWVTKLDDDTDEVYVYQND